MIKRPLSSASENQRIRKEIYNYLSAVEDAGLHSEIFLCWSGSGGSGGMPSSSSVVVARP